MAEWLKTLHDPVVVLYSTIVSVILDEVLDHDRPIEVEVRLYVVIPVGGEI
jgi:hypothetical protein